MEIRVGNWENGQVPQIGIEMWNRDLSDIRDFKDLTSVNFKRIFASHLADENELEVDNVGLLQYMVEPASGVSLNSNLKKLTVRLRVGKRFKVRIMR